MGVRRFPRRRQHPEAPESAARLRGSRPQHLFYLRAIFLAIYLLKNHRKIKKKHSVLIRAIKGLLFFFFGGGGGGGGFLGKE